ncbi:uncharacterized protein LOC5507686 [Nematostella vectensis]|uniref:uncharacterized protein LOC5507686 n=1 Tax=Nematostella vectensis TaxID=45351 RepID=UPI0020774B03|nr:uncharacterized protein LOC5507686 [Nematostella vectensis]
MNWVGGARNRVKLKHERKIQKEFFERKRHAKKVFRIKCRSPDGRGKRGISQDLLALNTVISAHDKPVNTIGKPRLPQKIDMDHTPLKMFGRRPSVIELPESPGHKRLSKIELTSAKEDKKIDSFIQSEKILHQKKSESFMKQEQENGYHITAGSVQRKSLNNAPKTCITSLAPSTEIPLSKLPLPLNGRLGLYGQLDFDLSWKSSHHGMSREGKKSLENKKTNKEAYFENNVFSKESIFCKEESGRKCQQVPEVCTMGQNFSIQKYFETVHNDPPSITPMKMNDSTQGVPCFESKTNSSQSRSYKSPDLNPYSEPGPLFHSDTNASNIVKAPSKKHAAQHKSEETDTRSGKIYSLRKQLDWNKLCSPTFLDQSNVGDRRDKMSGFAIECGMGCECKSDMIEGVKDHNPEQDNVKTDPTDEALQEVMDMEADDAEAYSEVSSSWSSFSERNTQETVNELEQSTQSKAEVSKTSNINEEIIVNVSQGASLAIRKTRQNIELPQLRKYHIKTSNSTVKDDHSGRRESLANDCVLFKKNGMEEDSQGENTAAGRASGIPLSNANLHGLKEGEEILVCDEKIEDLLSQPDTKTCNFPVNVANLCDMSPLHPSFTPSVKAKQKKDNWTQWDPVKESMNEKTTQTRGGIFTTTATQTDVETREENIEKACQTIEERLEEGALDAKKTIDNDNHTDAKRSGQSDLNWYETLLRKLFTPSP